MLGYFPDPYPDELFYSLCARFSNRMNYPTSDAVMRELFGLKSMRMLATLPSHLDHLVAQLPPLACYKAQQFIDEHTLFPYYAPFLPVDRLSRLQQAMQGDAGLATNLPAGTNNHRIPLRQWLRFCPACIEVDRRTFGESYWHRLHQVSGVEVCPTHHVFLQNSAARPYDPYHHYQLRSAESAIQLTTTHSLDPANASHRTLLQIACDTDWLLNQHGLSVSGKGLKQRYVALLYAQKLATYNGVIHIRKAVSRVRTHYTPDLLALLSSRLGESDQINWLVNFLRDPSGGSPPILHLLMMQFLGYTVEQFFTLPFEHAPFGTGPWPCLNPTCEFYRQPIIQEYQLLANTSLRRPRGLFACTCGFEYYRIGPDQSADDQFRYSSVKTYGLTWDDALRKKWQDATIPFIHLATQLGTTRVALKRYASSLGLPFPRPGGRVDSSTDEAKWRSGKTAKRTTEQRSNKQAAYREMWTSAMEEHPEWGLSDLAQKMSGVYGWFRRNDREWLQERTPRRPSGTRGGQKETSEYWLQRDNKLAEEVSAAAQRLRDAPGPPIRITRHAIAAEINQFAALYQQVEKLPKTFKVLAEALETREEAGVRRLWWWAEYYRREHLHPPRWQVIQQAGVDNLIAQPLVKEAIDAVFSMLNL